MEIIKLIVLFSVISVIVYLPILFHQYRTVKRHYLEVLNTNLRVVDNHMKSVLKNLQLERELSDLRRSKHNLISKVSLLEQRELELFYVYDCMIQNKMREIYNRVYYHPEADVLLTLSDLTLIGKLNDSKD